VIDEHAFVEFDWVYPHDPDPSLLWNAQVTIAVSGNHVEVAILVRITSVEFSVKPLEYDLGRPRVIPALFEQFKCVAGPYQLQAAPTELDTREVAPFVERCLLNRDRRLPVVMVSPEVWTDKFLIDAKVLQSTLAGLAIVVVLKTKWAAFELTDAVGRLFSCYGGAVRVYWPGFRPDESDSLRHQVFLPASIRANLARGRSLDRYIFRMLSALSAFRFTQGEITTQARTAVEKDRRAQFDALLEKSKQGDSAADKELLEFALEENVRLEREIAISKQRVSDLEREVETYQVNLATAYQYGPAAEPDQSKELQTEEVNSVSDALEQTAQRHADVIEVYETASKSARSSDFARPEDILRALLAIADLGKEYFASKGKTSMGPWEAFFEKRGFKYASTESQNTLNMYGDDRKFTHAGRRVQMLKHLTIGKGDTKNCVHIYFEPNEKLKRIEIGYCGRHLPYYGM